MADLFTWWNILCMEDLCDWWVGLGLGLGCWVEGVHIYGLLSHYYGLCESFLLYYKWVIKLARSAGFFTN